MPVYLTAIDNYRRFTISVNSGDKNVAIEIAETYLRQMNFDAKIATTQTLPVTGGTVIVSNKHKKDSIISVEIESRYPSLPEGY